MTADDLRTHIRYSGWASRRLLDAVSAMKDEDRARDLGVSHKSLNGTLEHIFFGDRVWCSRVVDPSVIGGAWTDVRDLAAEWTEIQRRWEEWAAGLTDADLARVVEYKDLKGNPHNTPVWQIVMHVVNHATLHRGQAMAIIRQLGSPPPPTDLIYFYRELSQ
jgi:uncharacterized damage-inducible protein DinB